MKPFEPFNPKNLRKIDLGDFYRSKTQRLLRTSVTLPSQYSSYAICVEVIKDWFLSKFPDHFFNSIYVDGSHSFDEFRKFSDMNDRLKRSNPLLAIVPEIDLAHNRDWVDSTPEFPLALRRTKVENSFLNDDRDNRGLHLQLQGKTISMNFTFKIRLDTYAESLDMIEYLKMKHRAGWSETRDVDLDVHVPRSIITQIAWDNEIRINEDGSPVDPIEMLSYLNQYSYIPFMYKLRCATGNNEYFLRIPNCVYHIKSELPTGDKGEREGLVNRNYIVEFTLQVEMDAPYYYTYYSQSEHQFIKPTPTLPEYGREYICVETHKKTDVSIVDEHNWHILTDEPLRYEVDEEDLGKEIDIDFKEQFEDTDIGALIQFNLDTYIAPEIFLSFKVFNEAEECEYEMNWDTLVMHVKKELTRPTVVIAIYADNKYINDTLMYLRDTKNNPTRH